MQRLRANLVSAALCCVHCDSWVVAVVIQVGTVLFRSVNPSEDNTSTTRKKKYWSCYAKILRVGVSKPVIITASFTGSEAEAEEYLDSRIRDHWVTKKRKRVPKAALGLPSRSSKRTSGNSTQYKETLTDGRKANKHGSQWPKKGSRDYNRMFNAMLRLQGKLDDLEEQKRKDDAEAAETIRRLQSALAQMTQNKGLPASKVQPRDAKLVGEPYNSPATFYRKLNDLEDAAHQIADQNTTRAQQLSQGLAKRMRVEDPNYSETDSAIADAVGEYIELILSEGKSKGRRTNFQNVCLDNIHNILAKAAEQKGIRCKPAIQMHRLS